jgi:hypothetical protein
VKLTKKVLEVLEWPVHRTELYFCAESVIGHGALCSCRPRAFPCWPGDLPVFAAKTKKAILILPETKRSVHLRCLYPCQIKSNLSRLSFNCSTDPRLRRTPFNLTTFVLTFTLAFVHPRSLSLETPTPSHTPLFSFSPSGQTSERFSSSRYVRSQSSTTSTLPCTTSLPSLGTPSPHSPTRARPSPIDPSALINGPFRALHLTHCPSHVNFPRSVALIPFTAYPR